MKTTVVKKDYDEVMARPHYPHIRPWKPSIFFRSLIRFLTIIGLWGTGFTYETKGFEKLEKMSLA